MQSKDQNFDIETKNISPNFHTLPPIFELWQLTLNSLESQHDYFQFFLFMVITAVFPANTFYFTKDCAKIFPQYV